jgi:hypothetical protein
MGSKGQMIHWYGLQILAEKKITAGQSDHPPMNHHMDKVFPWTNRL